MKLPITFSFIALLVAFAFGRATSKGNDTANSTRLPDASSLNDSIIFDEFPFNPRTTELEDMGPTSGAIFDPNFYAGTELWETFVKKGEHLACLMRASDEAAGWLMKDTRNPPSAASPWKDNLPVELRKWYWHEEEVTQGDHCDFRTYGLEDAFEGLDIDPRPMWDENELPAYGENDCVSVVHWNPDLTDPADPNAERKPIRDQYYTINGRRYRATGGTYTFDLNIEDGAIIALNLLSPRISVEKAFQWGRPAQPGELPELRFASDIFWSYWSFGNPNIRNFRVYGALFVVNDRTVLLVTRAMRNVRKFAPEIWPGTTFRQGSDEFLALIGSPIGAIACHFLIGHKAELGLKKITKVIVVCDGNDQEQCTRINRGLHMFFVVEDQPPQNPNKKRENDDEAEDMSLAESRILHTTDDGRHVIREHKVMRNP